MEFWTKYKKQILMIIGALILVLLLVYFVFPRGQSYVTDIIRDMIKKESSMIDENQKKQIDAKEAEIGELKEKLQASEKKYSTLMKRVAQLEKDIYENEPPKTSSELRDRFNKLGYKPTN